MVGLGQFAISPDWGALIFIGPWTFCLANSYTSRTEIRCYYRGKSILLVRPLLHCLVSLRNFFSVSWRIRSESDPTPFQECLWASRCLRRSSYSLVLLGVLIMFGTLIHEWILHDGVSIKVGSFGGAWLAPNGICYRIFYTFREPVFAAVVPPSISPFAGVNPRYSSITW